MALSEGTYALGPHNGRVLVRTSRSGLGRRAGHDLTIEATQWSGSARVDLAAPESSAVRAAVAVEGLEVREGTGGVLPLTDSDRAEIKRNVRKILQAEKYPEITFVSGTVRGTLGDFTIEGDLSIGGVTRTATVRGAADGAKVAAHATVVQSRWGIKPYSAFFGALKLADGIEIEIEIDI